MPRTYLKPKPREPERPTAPRQERRVYFARCPWHPDAGSSCNVMEDVVFCLACGRQAPFAEWCARMREVKRQDEADEIARHYRGGMI